MKETNVTRGIAAIGAVGVVTAIAWIASEPVEATSTASRIAQLVGALALVALASMLIIATRMRFVDRLFGGLDKAYAVHMWLGIIALALLGAHALTHLAAGLTRPAQDMLVHVGGPTVALFLLVIVFALLIRKVRYEVWRFFHLAAAVPYVIGVAHYYGSSSFGPLGLAPFSVWLDLVNLAGLVAAAYCVLFYTRLGVQHAYRVAARRVVADGVLEFTSEPVAGALGFQPGQFAFVRVPRLKFRPHPFTISGGDAEALQFTVRDSGDDTGRLVSDLAVGDEVVVGGPYGGFDYTRGAAHQLWIADGIGITPFRSFYRSQIPEQFSIDLFYADHGNGVYVDELRAQDLPNLRVHLVDGGLTAEAVLAQAPSEQPREVYFCGPIPMGRALKASLKTSGAPIVGFNVKRFRF